MQQRLPEITRFGAQLIAISPELPDQSLSMVEKENLGFEVLSDFGNKTANDFGLVFTLDEELRPIYLNFGINLEEANGDNSFTLPLPATYVVEQNGTIISHFIDVDYTKRLEPDDIIKALERIS